MTDDEIIARDAREPFVADFDRLELPIDESHSHFCPDCRQRWACFEPVPPIDAEGVYCGWIEEVACESCLRARRTVHG